MSDLRTRVRAGFTIVELMVIVAVIAILAIIVVVSYEGTQRRTSDSILRSDLAQSASIVDLWIMRQGNSIEKLLDLYDGLGSSWVVGDGADNALTGTHIEWNDFDELPEINVSPGTTLEIVVRYNASDPEMVQANELMLSGNHFCMNISSPDSSYNYRPMSVVHRDYDKMLYYDSALGGVKEMSDLVQAFNNGDGLACAGHVIRYLAATP